MLGGNGAARSITPGNEDATQCTTQCTSSGLLGQRYIWQNPARCARLVSDVVCEPGSVTSDV